MHSKLAAIVAMENRAPVWVKEAMDGFPDLRENLRVWELLTRVVEAQRKYEEE